MRQKKVWRYYCDYCGKGGCAKGHMARHEKHCTMNPQRECRMCRMDEDQVQVPLAEIIAAIKETARPMFDEIEELATGDYVVSLDALIKASGGCPACMLAALRQGGYLADDDWNYKTASQEWVEKDSGSYA